MRLYDLALRLILVVLITLPSLGLAQGTVPADGGAAGDSRPAEQGTSTAQGTQTGTAPAASTPAADEPASQAGAPAGGAAEPTQTGSGASGSSGGTPAPAAAVAPAATPGTSAVPSSTEAPSGTQTTTPTNPTAGSAASAPITPPAPEAIPVESGTTSYMWVVIACFVLAIIPFGFIVLAFSRKKTPDEESANRCFDIEQMMKDKLRELTDLKAMAKGKAVQKGKELARDLVSGTKTGDLLVRIEKAESQYNKLKKLFEECQVDIDRYKFKGILVENSLLDKEILKQVRIIRSREDGDRVLHDIRLSKKQIEDIQKNIIDTKWFFHLWEPGKDTVQVVFKDKQFEIKHSDRSTWKPAIEHGIKNGIPEAQLDFKIE